MRKLYCWLLAKYRFTRFLNRNIYLKNTITKSETKEYVKSLADYIFRKKFGEKK